MQQIDNATKALLELDWAELQALMLACSEGHALMCAAASEDIDPHVARETMRSRIADMSKGDIAGALAPFAAIGEFLEARRHSRPG